MQIMTTDNDDEIKQLLEMLLKASRLGVVHESVNVNALGQYTSTFFPSPLSFPQLWDEVDRRQGAGSHGQMQFMRKRSLT